MADGSQIKLDELDRLLNDPDVPMEAARVWELLDELSDAAARREVAASDRPIAITGSRGLQQHNIRSRCDRLMRVVDGD